MTFLVTFDVSPKAELGDRLLLRARVGSENNVPGTPKTTFQLELPVKYAVYTMISSHDQFTKYLNFSTSEKEKTSVVEHRFQASVGTWKRGNWEVGTEEPGVGSAISAFCTGE